jgi:F-type H+-transporting ATPase subunit gamma
VGQNLRAYRRKIKATRNIRQITRAMKMVAAAKLKRVEAQVAAGRLYYEQLQALLARVAGASGEVEHPLLAEREVRRAALVVVAGEKGLCGGYNSSILRLARNYAAENPGVEVQYIPVGAKAAAFIRRAGLPVLETFPAITDEGRKEEAALLARYIRDIYTSGAVDRVDVAYAEFVSAIHNTPQTVTLLPLSGHDTHAQTGGQYIFEPEPELVLAALLPRAVDAEIYQILLDAAASEQGSRMTAMTSATDNADEIIVNLTRDLNRARQAQITSEILEVVSGADALAGG